VGTQVMTINTTARMATKNINCQLVLAVGSQAIQRFNFISTNVELSVLQQNQLTLSVEG
jgi:hypothetical protein